MDKAMKVNLQTMKLESTKEYMETHYFKSTQVVNEKRFDKAKNCLFFKDYITYLLKGDFSKPFLSSNLLTLELNLLPFAFGLLDIPLLG